MFDNMIAKEGHKKIFYVFIAFLIFVILECGFLAFISFAIFAFLIYAYRYKYVDFTSLKENRLYAPISGRITAIDVKDFRKTIYIDVSLRDSHILRSLDSGKSETFIKRGVNLFLGTFKSKKLNENAVIKYNDSTMKLYSSMCNDNIEIASKLESIKGEKIGVFLQGEVVIELDESYNLDVSISDRVVSGETLIASKSLDS